MKKVSFFYTTSSSRRTTTSVPHTHRRAQTSCSGTPHSVVVVSTHVLAECTPALAGEITVVGTRPSPSARGRIHTPTSASFTPRAGRTRARSRRISPHLGSSRSTPPQLGTPSQPVHPITPCPFLSHLGHSFHRACLLCVRETCLVHSCHRQVPHGSDPRGPLLGRRPAAALAPRARPRRFPPPRHCDAAHARHSRRMRRAGPLREA